MTDTAFMTKVTNPSFATRHKAGGGANNDIVTRGSDASDGNAGGGGIGDADESCREDCDSAEL
jgi:hypothetical protein